VRLNDRVNLSDENQIPTVGEDHTFFAYRRSTSVSAGSSDVERRRLPSIIQRVFDRDRRTPANVSTEDGVRICEHIRANSDGKSRARVGNINVNDTCRMCWRDAVDVLTVDDNNARRCDATEGNCRAREKVDAGDCELSSAGRKTSRE
jgi:hypothetical protein